MTDPKPLFSLPRVEDLPEQLKGFFAKAVQEIGFVPNAFLSFANRPERFSAWFNHYRLVTEPTEGLSVADREMIAVVVSNLNSCTYCMTSHGHALRGETDPVHAERVSMNWRQAGLDERAEAICAYVEKLTVEPGHVGPADAEPLRAVGLSDTDIWDVVELAAMYAYTNRVSSAMGTSPNEEYHLGNRG